MWRDTRLTRLLGIELPIVCAPLGGGPGTPELAAAVSNAGGLGSLGIAYGSPDAIRSAIKAARALTDRPFQANLFVPPPHAPTLDATVVAHVESLLAGLRAGLELPDRLPVPARAAEDFAAQAQVLVDERVPVAGFAFGVPPAELVAALRERGTVVVGTATDVAEGRALLEAGVQVVCAQGAEAGGHRGQFLGGDGSDPQPAGDPIATMALVPAMADALSPSDAPLIAAGGLRDGRSVLAVLALGADGAQLGTAFLRTPEAGTNAAYREALARADGSATVLTTAFSGKPARGLRNAYVDALGVRPDVPAYPVMNALTGELRAAARAAGRSDLQSLWAGQGVAGTREDPAGDLVRTWAAEADALVERWSRQ